MLYNTIMKLLNNGQKICFVSSEWPWTLNLNHQIVIDFSLSPSGCLCQCWRNSFKTFLMFTRMGRTDGRPEHMAPSAYGLLLLHAGNWVLTELLWGYTRDEHMVPNPLTINLTISYSGNILAVVSEQADLQGLWMAQSQRTQNRQ